ncbi:transcription initiation factor TFIID subunit 8-like [Histomonas meleagridis]|uniref:transcription initiation factor TFIID subunit 8-like n=1 Tax=Histomonas meleagridis TaxID=135588 RepID=UPI00355A803B|nr:transcription initiation factor TFIID subunit 8-like [Histomonas meleagridis]KAH0806438.1 transcription initiation factor TFIID subunit 8-like [Histomonas meleagridis]
MSDEFTRHIVKLIIARTAQNKGFTSISKTSLEILVEIVIDRLFDYGRSVADVTTFCGRTDSNGYDVFVGLNKFQETVDSLSSFLNAGSSVPQFDFLVEPYPIPVPSKFFAVSTSNQQQKSTYPFRANTSFVVSNPGQGKRYHIPPFFAPPPDPFTYDHTIKPDPQLSDEPEIIKRREIDQASLQVALAQILSGKGTDSQTSVNFDCELTKLTSTELVTKPTELLESSLYTLEGERPHVDPEFLPIKNFKDSDIIGGNRDTPNMLSILAIGQGTSEPGTMKDSKYVSSTANVSEQKLNMKSNSQENE